MPAQYRTQYQFEQVTIKAHLLVTGVDLVAADGSVRTVSSVRKEGGKVYASVGRGPTELSFYGSETITIMRERHGRGA